MRYAIFAAAMLAASTAMAAPFARSSSGDWVRLLDKPCAAEVLALIPEAERDQYHAAKAQIDGKQFDACWEVVADAGAVHLVYADGDQGLVSMLAFHEDRDL
jgi:hypothetical protein